MSASSAGTPATKAARQAGRRRIAAVPAAPAAAPAPAAKGTARATIAAVTGRLGRAQVAAGISSAAAALVPQDSKGRRWLAYNGSAALVGHGALWLATGNPMGAEPLMAAAVQPGSVANCGAFALTCAVAYGGWKAGVVLRWLLGPIGRPAAAFGAALWGQGTAPLITDVMAATAPWSSMLLPLIAAGMLAGVCWWALDSRSAAWRAPARWAARIPLATLALGIALYAPGGTL